MIRHITRRRLTLAALVAGAIPHAALAQTKLKVAAGQFATHPALIERGHESRQKLRDGLFETFGPEFSALSTAAREELVDAILAALSVDAWTVLRRRDGLSLDRAKAAWKLTLTALLAQTVKA